MDGNATPRNKKNDGSVDPTVPEIPAELLDQFVAGPMTAESVEAVMRKFKKAILERDQRPSQTSALWVAGLSMNPRHALTAT
jgi:hypothetical protein